MFGMQEDISDLELKQRWRLFWLQTIFEFSNTKLQKMAWIQGTDAHWPDGEVWDSSFEECVSAYFETLALDDAYEKAVQWGNVSQEEADRAKHFHLLAVFYDAPDNDPQNILDDEEWLEVVEAAREFWDYLKTTVTSQREINLIQKLEKAFT